jgi:hypothetical protein
MKKDDTSEVNVPWDWPFLLYMSKRFFKYSDQEFWRSSPQKIFALIDAHIKFESGPSDEVKIDNA